MLIGYLRVAFGSSNLTPFGKTVIDMEKNEILEGNKLIAGFFGWGFTTKGHVEVPMFDNDIPAFNGIIWDNMVTMRADQLKFNTSWNWLMPLVDNIIEIDITAAPNWSGYRVEIVPRGYVKITGFPMEQIFRNVSIEGSLINAVYLACIDFIKYHNHQSPNPIEQ